MFSHYSNSHVTDLIKLCLFGSIVIVDKNLIELNPPFLFPSYFLIICCFLPSFSGILSVCFLPLRLSYLTFPHRFLVTSCIPLFVQIQSYYELYKITYLFSSSYEESFISL